MPERFTVNERVAEPQGMMVDDQIVSPGEGAAKSVQATSGAAQQREARSGVIRVTVGKGDPDEISTMVSDLRDLAGVKTRGAAVYIKDACQLPGGVAFPSGSIAEISNRTTYDQVLNNRHCVVLEEFAGDYPEGESVVVLLLGSNR